MLNNPPLNYKYWQIYRLGCMTKKKRFKMRIQIRQNHNLPNVIQVRTVILILRFACTFIPQSQLNKQKQHIKKIERKFQHVE